MGVKRQQKGEMERSETEGTFYINWKCLTSELKPGGARREDIYIEDERKYQNS